LASSLHPYRFFASLTSSLILSLFLSVLKVLAAQIEEKGGWWRQIKGEGGLPAVPDHGR
jgi:hypothetical protein